MADENSFTDGRVKLRHLQCFLAVADQGSLQKAAPRLAITQPAVSKTLAELEDMLGVALFVRGRSGAAATREALRFLPHARACLAALRAGMGALSDVSMRKAGYASLGILPTLSAALLPAALSHLQREWPDVSLRVVTGTNRELLMKLRAGEIELAVNRAADPEFMTGLDFEYLYSEPLVVVVRVGHPLHAKAGGDPARIPDYPVLLPPIGTVIRQLADHLLAASGVAALTSVIELLSVSAGRALTLESDAVWFVPRSAVARDLSNGSFTCLSLAGGGTQESVGLTLRAGGPRTAFSQALRDAFRAAARGAAPVA